MGLWRGPPFLGGCGPCPGNCTVDALSPARVTRVDVVDPIAMEARVIVPDYQLSLAIGKEGQNARLAARLTGWRIDIRSDAPVGEPPPGPVGEPPPGPVPRQAGEVGRDAGAGRVGGNAGTASAS